MIRSIHIRFICVLVFLAFSCEKISFEIEAETPDNRSWEEVQARLEDEGLYSEQRFRHPSMSEEVYQGAVNAVKKAYQLTDISFTPLQPIANNIGIYQTDSTYTGMIYSSVKEIGTYVGSNISFHTFMTAIHNPRSKVYTDRIDKSPYHGTNCRSYYGTVCSALVSYALGLMPIYVSSDFVSSDEMEEIDISNYDGFHIADVLWRNGHVAIITDVVRDGEDRVVRVEVSESIVQGSRRYTIPRSSMNTLIGNRYSRMFRYNRLDTNTDYTPAPEFVSVMDEMPLPYTYNTDLCVNKGDRSCYFVGEKVTVNILSPGDSVEIYKDGALMAAIPVETEDIRLTDLDYGLYQARLMKADGYSDFTSWMMVDRTVVPAVDEMKLYFNSENAIPVSVFVCGKTGGRNAAVSEIICKRFTEEEIDRGYLEVSQDRLLRDQPYFMVTFATEFGNISTTPIEWK